MTKILVVDDEIPEQRHLSDILYSSFPGSVTVQCADNGKEAVSQATLWNPDIILMDIRMPEMNGLDATRIIKEVNHDEILVGEAKIKISRAKKKGFTNCLCSYLGQI